MTLTKKSKFQKGKSAEKAGFLFGLKSGEICHKIPEEEYRHYQYDQIITFMHKVSVYYFKIFKFAGVTFFNNFNAVHSCKYRTFL